VAVCTGTSHSEGRLTHCRLSNGEQTLIHHYSLPSTATLSLSLARRRKGF